MNIPQYQDVVCEILDTYSAKAIESLVDCSAEANTQVYNALLDNSEQIEAQILQATKELIYSLTADYEDKYADTNFHHRAEHRNALRDELRNAVAEMGEK